MRERDESDSSRKCLYLSANLVVWRREASWKVHDVRKDSRHASGPLTDNDPRYSEVDAAAHRGGRHGPRRTRRRGGATRLPAAQGSSRVVSVGGQCPRHLVLPVPARLAVHRPGGPGILLRGPGYLEHGGAAER